MQEELFSVVHGISDIIAQGSDPKKTLQTICNYLADQLNVKFAAICLYDESEHKLTLRAVHGVYLVELEKYHPEENISWKAFKESRVVNIPRVSKCVSEENLKSNCFLMRINSVLAVPLKIGGRTVGTIAIARASQQAFPSRIVSLMETLATSLAMFIVNSLLNTDAVDDHSRNKSKAGLIPQGSGFETLSGRSIVPGVCAGRALLLFSDDILRNQPLETSQNPEAELQLLQKAYSIARESLRKITAEVNEKLTEADSSIFEMHSLLLEDPTLHQRICKYIDGGYTVCTAISQTYKEFENEYQKIEDEYLRERLRDIEDVLLRLLNSTRVPEPLDPSDQRSRKMQKVILVARELLPSQLISSPLRQVAGILCESGGATSHAAILARALRIPMLAGVNNIREKIHADDPILLDCHSGTCYLHPSAMLLQQFKSPMAQTNKRRNAAAAAEADIPVNENPLTKDGTQIGIRGNVTLFSELPLLHNAGVESIGLYRAEFMFMIRNAMPDEEEQTRVLTRLVEGARGGMVTIRALDIGGDKPLPYLKWDNELNPSLGWRGLRFLLSNPEYLLPHLKAILRTTVKGDVRLMFPMVADCGDFLKARQMVEEAKRELKREGKAFKDPKIGMMLEVPSAVADLENLLPEVDFISIGTNDLIQYLFAVDRGNSHVNKWFRQYHPIVFRALRYICQAARRFPDKEVSICGELGGNPRALPLLLGVGLRKFSMNAASIAVFRDYLPKLDISECEAFANRVLAYQKDSDILHALDDYAIANGMRLKDF